MASIEKYTNSSMMMLLKHSERRLINDSNTEIIPEKTCLNYSMPLDHNDMTDMAYYKKIIGDSYIYGRGSKREEKAVTCCSWVITLPKEVSDYTNIDKNKVIRLHPEEEKQFFQGSLDFVANRYGKENIIHAKVHYDEGGQPHAHIYFLPRKELDHNETRYKTVTTKSRSIKTETGRWEYQHKYILNDGRQVDVKEYEKYLTADNAADTRIPLANYSKISDYYDFKLAAAEIINPIELRHFHPDFARYLREHNIPGANSVHTGVTGGRNISVNAMKSFTRATGLTIDQVQDMQIEKIDMAERIKWLEKDLKNAFVSISDKDRIIEQLQNDKTIALSELTAKDKEIDMLKQELSLTQNELQEIQLKHQQEIEKREYENNLTSKDSSHDHKLSVDKDVYDYLYDF